ncbi:MAG: NAD(P)/FAD-dependent oxidoreductase [Parvibaculaceae bacterium]
MGESVDVVIAGGAAVGSATAYYLKKHGFKGSVLVLERDLGFAECSTTRSLGGIRQLFSTEENILLSQFGMRLLRNLKEEFGSEADVSYREQGYLILASEQGEPILRQTAALQNSMGASTLVLDPPALEARFPWLSPQGIAAGAFGSKGDGWVDPWSLMSLFRKGAETKGVEWRQGVVNALGIEGGKVHSVGLADGSEISCGAFVNAAGPGGGAIAAMAGIEHPVGPRKRYIYVLDCREADEALHRAPLTINPQGVYMRPEGRSFLAGLAPEEHEEPEATGYDVDFTWFEERIWPALAELIPVFEAVKVVNSWVGYYDHNAFDHNAVIGPHPEIGNFYFNNGFSGHGLQQSPAAGNAVAELIVHGEYREIDLKRFGYERFRDGQPLREINVV